MRASDLERLFALHQSGALTEAEYLSAKARLLAADTTGPERAPARPSFALPTIRLNSTRMLMFLFSVVVGLSFFLPWFRSDDFFGFREVWSAVIRQNRSTSLVIASTGMTAAMIVSPLLPGRRLRAALALLTSLASLPLFAATYLFSSPALFLRWGWERFLEEASKFGSGAITFIVASFGIQAVAMWDLVPRSDPERLLDRRSLRVGAAQLAGLLLLFGVAALSQRFLVEVVRTGGFFR